MSFHVGQKVVCVDDRSRPIYGPDLNHLLNRGAIYTVSATRIDPYTGFHAVRMEELPETHSDGGAIWYQSKRFRPITERKTDISIFKRMLTPSEIKKAERELV